MPPTPRRRRTPDEARAELIAAAVRVVAARGLRGLTYRAVAAESGMNQALVAHHFGSREALIREALRAATTATVGEAHAGGDGSLAAFGSGLAAMVASTEELQAFLLELALEARRTPALAEENRETYRRYVDGTREALGRAGVEASPALARLVFAALDGLVLQQLVHGDAAATDAAVAELRALLAARAEAPREAPGGRPGRGPAG